MQTSMKGVSVARPLSDDKFDQLSEFLKKTGHSAINLEGVDGLFCALICGPELVLPSEYLSQIWVETFVFDNQDYMDKIMGLLMRHWNTIARSLHGTLKAPDIHVPVLFVGNDGVARGNDWAQGFMRGALMRPIFSHELLESDEDGELLLPIMLLSHEHDSDPTMRPFPVPPEKREDILMEMIAALAKIYRHFEPFVAPHQTTFTRRRNRSVELGPKSAGVTPAHVAAVKHTSGAAR